MTVSSVETSKQSVLSLGGPLIISWELIQLAKGMVILASRYFHPMWGDKLTSLD